MATVNSGDTITAAQYNDLQSRVNNIMGTGSGQSGYGQALASAQVSTGNVVTATQMDNLRTDINKANNHQSGTSSGIGNIAVGQIIGADASGTSVGSLTQTTEGYNDYDAAVTAITTNKFLIDSTQGTLESVTSSSRNTNWQVELQHVFTLDFTNANNARFFFNSGSDIRISLALTGQSGSKSNTWSTLLSNIGTVIFNYTSTTQSGSGGSFPGTRGWYDLDTNRYLVIFTQSVGGGGVYDENEVEISALKNEDSSTLTFRIRIIDADTGDQRPGYLPGPGEDEPVNGTISSTIQRFRATGTNVEVTAPSATNNTLLTAGS